MPETDNYQNPTAPSSEKDNVNHPKHYNSHPSGIECIEIVRHHDFNIGNAIKYLWRAGLKGGEDKLIEDLEKAIFYINDEIQLIKKQREQKKTAAEQE